MNINTETFLQNLDKLIKKNWKYSLSLKNKLHDNLDLEFSLEQIEPLIDLKNQLEGRKMASTVN